MPRRAPVLAVGLGDVDTWRPNRDRASDGWIGDKPHQLTKSDHNANADGIVHAQDFDADGIDAPALVAALIAHPSTHYVIYNRTIWSRAHGFKPRRYTGSNPHTGHVHWSILHTAAAENSTVHLRLGGGTPPGPAAGGGIAPMPVLRRGSKVPSVRTLQGALHRGGHPVPIDGDFGPATDRAVRAFQSGRRITADGVVGPRTWCALAQACLNWCGFGAGAVDGVLGPRTVAAIRAMQQARGIRVDGILGPKSWEQLT